MSRFPRACLAALGIHVGLLWPIGIGAISAPAVSVMTGPASMAVAYQPWQPEKIADHQMTVAETTGEQAKTATAAPRGTPPALARDGVEGTPLHYLRNPPPRYPREAYRNHIQGSVWIVAEVDARGWPTEVAVERSSGSPLLDRAAMEAVHAWTFVPAMLGAHPVGSRCRIPIQFRIEDPH